MYRQSKKRIKQQYISSTCRHNMVNFGPLAAEIGWQVWGTPANFNGFRVLASLLRRRRSTEVNQNFARCLAVSWPGTLYIHFRGLLPVTEFCQVQYSLCIQVLRSPIVAALLHGTRAVNIIPTLPCSAEGAAYIRQGGHHVGHWPTL